jgi:hypothetical protein
MYKLCINESKLYQARQQVVVELQRNVILDSIVEAISLVTRMTR